MGARLGAALQRLGVGDKREADGRDEVPHAIYVETGAAALTQANG